MSVVFKADETQWLTTQTWGGAYDANQSTHGRYLPESEILASRTDKLKAVAQAIPTTTLLVGWHVRGEKAWICMDAHPVLKKGKRNGEGMPECYSHSLPLIWQEYERGKTGYEKAVEQGKECQKRRTEKARAARAARSGEAPGSSLHPPASGPDPGGVVRVRLGAGKADSLLHPAEEEVRGELSGGEDADVAELSLRERAGEGGE